MADATQCDKCKKFCTDVKLTRFTGVVDRTGRVRKVDFCDGCYVLFDKWLDDLVDRKGETDG